MPPRVRLSTGAPLGDCDLTLYQVLGNSNPQCTEGSLSLELEAANLDRRQLSVAQGSDHKLSKTVDHQGRDLSAEPPQLANCQNSSLQANKQQNADKENLLMHLRIPRFNIIEASSNICQSALVTNTQCAHLMQRALALAVEGKLTKEAYKFKVQHLNSAGSWLFGDTFTRQVAHAKNTLCLAGIRSGQLDLNSADCK